MGAGIRTPPSRKKNKRMTVIVPSVISVALRLEAARHGVKSYYLVAAALAAWLGRCSTCGVKLEHVPLEEDILIRCDPCVIAGKVPDRTEVGGDSD